MRYHLFTIVLLASLCCAAQPNPPQSLHQLLQLAETNYPLLKSKQFSMDAAQKAVEISKNSKMPTVDAAYQMNYSTYNNITGMAYPRLLIPISGPPSASNIYNGTFGSAASLLFNWQAITFGQRSAQIAQSEAGVKYATADAANEILQHKIKVADAYLDALTFIELEKLYQDNISRAATNLSTVNNLVTNGIKPGVDTALFSGEVSRARIDWLNIKKNEEQAIIVLKQLLATENNIVINDSSYFSKLPIIVSTNDTGANPLLTLYNSSIDVEIAKRKSMAKTSLPTLDIWATTYARGSGIAYTGDVKNADGLGFQRFNYGAGLQLSIPLLQSVKIKPQLQQQDLLIKTGQEKLNEINLQLNKQLQTADNSLKYALAIVQESPALIRSANYAYTAMLSRYNSGLANQADVIAVQYNLLKAQTDYKTAYMAVWKTLLFKAAIKGDINLFLNQVN
jgi:outer membrane protein